MGAVRCYSRVDAFNNMQPDILKTHRVLGLRSNFKLTFRCHIIYDSIGVVKKSKMVAILMLTFRNEKFIREKTAFSLLITSDTSQI